MLDKEIFNTDVFQKVCPLGDDIWLNAYTRLAGQKTYVINNKSAHILNVQIPHDIRLFTENCGENQNDKQIKSVSSYIKKAFGVDPFVEKYIKQEYERKH